MSVNALAIINEAALACGDPRFSRIDRDEWKMILNQSCRDLSRKMRLTLHTATFDITAGDAEYAFPDDCIQIKSLRWSDNPLDPSLWRWVEELFEDEYRSLTNLAQSTGVPTGYHPQVDTYFMNPIPDATIVGGGKIQYWGMPDEVTNPETERIPVLDVLRDTLRERMVIYAMRRLEKWDAAQARELEWQATLVVDRDRIEDRSADRRSKLRANNSFSRYAR